MLLVELTTGSPNYIIENITVTNKNEKNKNLDCSGFEQPAEMVLVRPTSQINMTNKNNIDFTRSRFEQPAEMVLVGPTDTARFDNGICGFKQPAEMVLVGPTRKSIDNENLKQPIRAPIRADNLNNDNNFSRPIRAGVNLPI